MPAPPQAVERFPDFGGGAIQVVGGPCVRIGIASPDAAAGTRTE